MICTANLVTFRRQDIANSAFSSLSAGRYCILLMSFFAIYCGLIYNEAFSIPTTVFGTGHWGCDGKDFSNRVDMAFDEELCPSAFKDGLQMKTPASPYPFGIDPTWHGTRTELEYLNSLKMKISIILG